MSAPPHARTIRAKVCGVVGLVATVAQMAAAQDALRQPGGPPSESNPAYDGRFAFMRLRYRTALPDRSELCSESGQGEPDGWSHNYPQGERNLLKILAQITSLHSRLDSTAVRTVDDPVLLKYPVSYVAEAACWQPSDAEVLALRRYLLKGGLLLVDDLTFGGPHSDPTVYQLADETIAAHLKRVLPEGKLIPISANDPVFRTFFALDPQHLVPLRPGVPHMEFRGIYEDNDPTKRLLVLVTYHISIAFYWSWAEQGFYPVEVGNEAYKLGVNFILYGLTH